MTLGSKNTHHPDWGGAGGSPQLQTGLWSLTAQGCQPPGCPFQRCQLPPVLWPLGQLIDKRLQRLSGEEMMPLTGLGRVSPCPGRQLLRHSLKSGPSLLRSSQAGSSHEMECGCSMETDCEKFGCHQFHQMEEPERPGQGLHSLSPEPQLTQGQHSANSRPLLCFSTSSGFVLHFLALLSSDWRCLP